ncbi:hypothetical protein NQ314_020479 [Rhamnusium bicolor]|uniref:Protein lava lamp n=1 Tax=Rhamnusium bicolor TaxID=1586634 RepID=A0AAV8WLU3_9CUCU|nr:hypothetical protein NQ314_020479 [Rhamnusium bicolor]
MWKEPDPDPGGDTQKVTSGQSTQELSDPKDEYEQQQLLLPQLKEMLRKEQSNVSEEKIKEYINTLSKVKAKKTKVRKDESGRTESSVSSSSIDINKKGKLNLLRQQLEENKARLAERGKNQRGIEEMVTQLKAQLNDSQQLIPQNLSLPDPKNLEYSRDSTQEELYNILLSREKRITELLNKSQKQEATILDLQENLKEKDSVIDARTKAVTLMTDSLSKKGKTTLDALDDTKEQMRKMQENFVTLETELQESNHKLAEEKQDYLRTIDEIKNIKVEGEENKLEKSQNSIKELQQQLNQTKVENEDNLLKILELKKQLQESVEDLNRFKNTGLSVGSVENNDVEISKLKKQLDESNKSMIRIKAQSKSKIKELTKKIDLQTENTKLSEKIAELEEEKGNMQLKMVESTDSVKDSTQLEHKELENKLAQNAEALEEKDKIITILESDIISLKAEINGLQDQISGFSHLENVQVTSEIKSIQIEEQMEEIESENLKLKNKIEQILNEKEELVERIEELKKEKQEISSKLDSYIQENMELIDKLEKLSAEKVSSAESIEIVEGLTQQEKLELAAYQKNLDIHIEGEPIKCSEDDAIEPPAELNESVLQLSEDSTELLQKIDMFTMERKEVMGKMEALKEENNQLNVKLREIENNRDILAETYEQLQNEKEVLQNENDELVRRLQKLEEGIPPKKIELEDDSSDVTAKLQDLQREYERLLAENEELNHTLKGYDTQIHENHNLVSELSQARQKIEDLETKIKINLEELTNYETVIEENKNEFINSAGIINELQEKLSAREIDIADLHVIINDLNKVVSNLQNENNKLINLDLMETEVSEMKEALNYQIQQAQDYEEEISRSNDIINDLNTKLVEMNKKIIETEHEMEMKDIEVKKLVQDLQNREEAIKSLQSQVQEKDKKINYVVEEMKQKYLALQKQLDGNSGSLESKVTELTNKNKEQLEKMKKIAANLKKKTQAYQELEERYNGEKEKWETEVNEKESIITDSKGKIDRILKQLRELEEEVVVKTKKLAEAEYKERELSEIIHNLEQNKIELQNSIIEFKHKEEKLNEVSLKQELSTSLHEEFDNIPSNQESANEEKIKELELIIETNQADLAHYNERVHKLEESIAHLEEEKDNLERKVLELSEQLSVTLRNVAEKAMLEEELGQKLAQVSANDEVLMKKLEEVTEENRELNQKNREIEELNYKLKVKLKKAHEKVTQLKSLQANVEEFESANSELKKQLAVLEANQKHIQDENEELQKRNQNDYEKIEADYQAQLEELVKCKQELTVECEKLQEMLKEMQGREVELLSEIAEYRQKMEGNEASDQEKIQQLTEELKVVNLKCKDSVKEIDSLNDQIKVLRQEIEVVKVAKETVQGVVNEAQERIVSMNTVSSQTDNLEDSVETIESNIKEQVIENIKPSETLLETVPTFHWPGSQQSNQSQDWFADQNQSSSNDPPNVPANWFNKGAPQVNLFHSQQPVLTQHLDAQPPAVVENTKEALLSKIKALEFLLYNIDKEKEEALQDCTGMINELTHLVYEKVNLPTTEAVNPPPEIESQILSTEDIVDAAADKKQLQRIEFEKTDVALGEQSHPVVEEVVQPKRAYLTYQPEDKVPSSGKLEAFGENDDGWGWGPEEAKLEEEHLYKAENIPQMQNLRGEIAQLHERIQVLQVERENHLEEIKQLQIKSGKLIKKCKELKQKNDQLLVQQQIKKSEGADFFDLDETIQEELKTQIAQLEKKIKELTSELEKEKQEKTNILKRVDVLTSANERMLEMKEIQDTEVLRWKRKHQEAEEKLQQHQWGSDAFNESVKPKNNVNEASASNDNKTIEELQQTIKELSLDNDELQALLDEQRQLRINAEKAKSSPDTTRTEEEYTRLATELESKIKMLEQELANKSEEMQVVLNERNEVSAQNNKLQNVISEKERSIAEFQASLRNLSDKNDEFEVLLADKDKLSRDLLDNEKNSNIQQELGNRISELEKDLLQLKESNANLEGLLSQKDAAFIHLKADLEQISDQKEELSVQVKQLTNYLEQQRQNYDELNLENTRNISDLQNKLEQQKQKCEQLQVENAEKINEVELQKQMYDNLQIEDIEKINGLTAELAEQKLICEKLGLEMTEKIGELELLSQKLQNKQFESSENNSFELTQQKYQLESLLAEKEANINEANSKKAELEEEVKLLTHSLEEKQKEYEKLLNETDEKLSRTAAELEESWAVQVDQRGADIAESWKLHLETVEADFAAIQGKLKYEINELEEKCNALVNENNELRKNVDAEIRNEVDRISALQQQINDRQHHITELNNTLVEKQRENESLIEKLTVLENEKEQFRNEIVNKDTKLASLNIIIETTQKQFDEKREVVEEIVRILEKNTSWPLSYEREDVLNEFQRQLNVVSEKEQEVLELNQTIHSLQSQFNVVQEKDGEIFKLNELVEDLQRQLALDQEKDEEIFRLNKLVVESQKQLHEKDMDIFNLNKLIEDLQNQLTSIQEKDEEIFRLNQLTQELQAQLDLLQEKEGEILRLNQIIENYKVQHELNQKALAVVQQEQANTNYAVEGYKQRLEEFKITHIALRNSLEEKNQLIATLNQQLQLTESLKNDNNEDVVNLQEEISQVKNDCFVLQQSLAECQQQLFNVTGELTNKSNELENVSQQLSYSQQNFEIQEAELNKLRDVLQLKEQEFSISVENLRKSKLQDLENHYEEVIAAKDLDIESFRLQLNESIQNSQQLSDKVSIEVHLRQQLEQSVKQLEEKIAEQSALLDEENKQLGEMRTIIEQQVIKIEELKKELFEKSSDYDSLIAEMDIGTAITQQPTPSGPTGNVVETASTSQSHRPLEDDDLSEPVRRAELDLALYMLHQRDVRCEELTVELTQLLEERDTLQLRLSNAIREKEEIRRKFTESEEVATPSSPLPVTPHSKSSAIFLSASGTELATEPLEEVSSDVHNLESKLSQLKSVGYKKDKTFVDEQQLRRLQQMSIMQQHMQEASKLPPEAAAKLVGASYTLSRDVQSPTNVLLDWLLGRSTPKVNDT